MVVTQPAGAPFESLAVGAGQSRGLDPSALEASSHGLIHIARQLSADESLLVVVDQFEELFRYKDIRRSLKRRGGGVGASRPTPRSSCSSCWRLRVTIRRSTSCSRCDRTISATVPSSATCRRRSMTASISSRA